MVSDLVILLNNSLLFVEEVNHLNLVSDNKSSISLVSKLIPSQL